MQEESILVIDDDASILAMVSEMLEFEGYKVARASNGADGLKLLAESTPSLVLLDMRMPVMDGWHFAEHLQEQRGAPPVLVMTAAQDARHWAQQIDAVGYLAKPFELPELISAVEYVLHVD